jgi:CBS domain-containing protein
MAQLKDILHGRALLSLGPDATVAEAAARMSALNIGAILVLDDTGLRGVFSERDIMRRVVAEGLDPHGTRVERVMSTDLTKAEEGASIEEAMELMRRCGCRHLPVMRRDQVVGFISMRDLMLYELEQKTDEIRHMRNYIQSA